MSKTKKDLENELGSVRVDLAFAQKRCKDMAHDLEAFERHERHLQGRIEGLELELQSDHDTIESLRRSLQDMHTAATDYLAAEARLTSTLNAREWSFKTSAMEKRNKCLRVTHIQPGDAIRVEKA